MVVAAATQFAVANWVSGLASFTVFFPAIVAGALLGAGPGAFGLGLSLALGRSYWTWTAGSTPPGSRDALDLFLIALSGAIMVLIKDWLNGIHHGVSAKHLQAYLNEFTFRFNRRFYPFNAFRSLLGIAGGVEAPTYADLYSGAWTHPTSSGCLR